MVHSSSFPSFRSSLFVVLAGLVAARTTVALRIQANEESSAPAPSSAGIIGIIGTSALWGGYGPFHGAFDTCDTPRPLYCFQQ